MRQNYLSIANSIMRDVKGVHDFCHKLGWEAKKAAIAAALKYWEKIKE